MQTTYHLLAPPHARGRGHPCDARGGCRVRAPGAAVQRRQGLDRAAAPGREGLSPGSLPIPADARRHGPQLPGGDRVPRPARRGDRRAADRGAGGGLDQERAGRRADAARGPRATACRPSRCWTPSPSTASTPPSAAQGATRSARRAKERILSFRDEFGQWEPQRQRPELWSLYNGAHSQGRARAGVSDLQLDRARCVAVHR